MNKLIVVVGCPASRTHYTSCILLAHPQIHPPRNDWGGSHWAEPFGVTNPLDEVGFIGFLKLCRDDYVVCNNHNWTFYLDLIRENCDCYIVETQRNYMDLLFRYVSGHRKYENLGEPTRWFCNAPQLFESVRRAGEELDPDSHWVVRTAAYIFANRFECLRHRDIVLTEDNYPRGIRNIQIDLGLDVYSYRELVDIGESEHPPSYFKRQGKPMKWDPSRVKLDSKTVRLIEEYRDEVEFWLDKIEGLRDG